MHMPHLRLDAGEHSDWAGSYRRFNRDLAPGMCLVSGTNQGMYARVRPHPHKLIVSSVDHAGNKYGPIELLMDPEVLLKAAASGDSYFSYIFGVAYQIAVRYNCRGLVIENYKTDLPQAKGLSSVPHSQPRVFASHCCCCCSHLLPIHACHPSVPSVGCGHRSRCACLQPGVRPQAVCARRRPGVATRVGPVATRLGPVATRLWPVVTSLGSITTSLGSAAAAASAELLCWSTLNAGEMDLAYHGEITTPSQCGRMDQCCAHACYALQVPRRGHDWVWQRATAPTSWRDACDARKAPRACGHRRWPCDQDSPSSGPHVMTPPAGAFGARPVLMKFDGDLLECVARLAR